MLFACIAFLVCTATAVHAQPDQWCCDPKYGACPYNPPPPPCPNGTACCMERPGGWAWGGSWCINATMTCSMCPTYNPNHPEDHPCPLASPVCCGTPAGGLYACYPSTMQCCHPYDGSNDSHPCPTTQTCCGVTNGKPSCCDPATQACVNDVCVKA